MATSPDSRVLEEEDIQTHQVHEEDSLPPLKVANQDPSREASHLTDAQPCLGLANHQSLGLAQEHKEVLSASCPVFMGPRNSLDWWRRHSTWEVQHLIAEGVKPSWSCPPRLSVSTFQRNSPQEVALAQTIMLEYQRVGAVTPVSLEGTAHLVPWFIISKPELGGGG